jgi:hypothetical protein
VCSPQREDYLGHEAAAIERGVVMLTELPPKTPNLVLRLSEVACLLPSCSGFGVCLDEPLAPLRCVWTLLRRARW